MKKISESDSDADVRFYALESMTGRFNFVFLYPELMKLSVMNIHISFLFIQSIKRAVTIVILRISLRPVD